MKNNNFIARLLPLTFVMAVLATSAYADAANSVFDGAYLGAGLGGSFTRGDLKAEPNSAADFDPQEGAPPNDISAALSATNTLKRNSFAGNLYAGYGHAWQPLYLGVEAFIKLANYKMNYAASTTATKTAGGGSYTLTDNLATASEVKLNPLEFGIDLRPGVLVTPNTLLFGRLGVAFNKLTLNSTTTTSGEYTNGAGFTKNFSGAITNTASKSVPGLRLGLGLEQHLNEHLALRLDYVYTYYGKISTNNSTAPLIDDGSGTGTVTGTVTDHTSAIVSNHTVMLGLSYYFGSAHTATAPAAVSGLGLCNYKSDKHITCWQRLYKAKAKA